MLIVLEGVDGAGKTTLTERLLASAPNHTLKLHCGPLKTDPVKEYVWALRDYSPGSGDHLICDRWHVGELIYGPLYRDKSLLTDDMRAYVESYLDRLGAYKLIVSADLQVIKHRLRTRGEDLLKEDHLGIVWDFYNEYAHEHDWQSVTSSAFTGSILDKARRLESAACRINPATSYVGPTKPDALVLAAGSTRPLNGRPSYKPAAPPYPDTIWSAVRREMDRQFDRPFGLVDPEQDDWRRLWRALGQPTVVAADSATAKSTHGCVINLDIKKGRA